MLYEVRTNERMFITDATPKLLHKVSLYYCKKRMKETGCRLSDCLFTFTPATFIPHKALWAKYLKDERT